MDLFFDLCVKLIFGVCLVVCLLDLLRHPWFSFAHICSAMEEKRLFESVYVNYWIEDFMLNVNFVLRTNIELYVNNEIGFSY